MKHIYFFIVTILLGFGKMAQAQSPCDAVSVEVIGMDPQSGSYNYFGVRVSLSQPFYQDVTVSGYIWDGPDDHGYNENHPYTLTIPAGYLTAETAVTFYQTGPAAEGAVNITSVSPCPSTDNAFTAVQLSSTSISSILSNAFDSLNVDMTKLSAALGLSSTLSKSNINFTNLELSYPTDADTSKAISASFNSNSASASANYTFTAFTDGTNYYNPTIIKTTASELKFFDLTEGKITTISNYTSSSFSISQATSDYMRAEVSYPCTGQEVADCVGNVYNSHGWFSVLSFTASLFKPWLGGAVVAACIRYHCVHLIHGPGYL